MNIVKFAGWWLEAVVWVFCVPVIIVLPLACTFPLWAHLVGIPEAPAWAKLFGGLLALVSWPLPILAISTGRKS